MINYFVAHTLSYIIYPYILFVYRQHQLISITDSGEADKSLTDNKSYSLVDIANAMIEYDFAKTGVNKRLPESGSGMKYNHYLLYDTD